MNPQHSAILLVEDDAVSRAVCKKILSQWQLFPDEAKDGLEAIVMASLRKYTLIIMDLQMPNKDGYATSQEIRKAGGINADTPILALSGTKKSVALAEKIKKAGINNYLEKPFDVEQLAHAIAPYIQVAQTKNIVQIEYLERFAMGNSEFLQQLKQLYAEAFAETATKLSEVVEKGSITELRFLAHKIKPSAKALNLNEVNELFDALIISTENNEPLSHSTEKLMQQLLKICQQIVQELQSKKLQM